MAYDPRTGITTYDELDAAADPSVDLAADVAPSTATAVAPVPVAPAGFFQTGTPAADAGYWDASVEGGMWTPVAPPAAPAFTGNAAIDWANQQAYNSYAWNPGDDVTARGWGQGLPREQVLFGGYGANPGMRQGFESLLNQISGAAGAGDFDWLAAQAAAAKAHADQFGTGYSISTPWDAMIEGIVANSGDPRIMQVWEQAGPEVKAQLADSYQKYLEYQRQKDKARRVRQISFLAAPFAAWAGPLVAGMFSPGGAAAGLTASELALADIALGGLGGSAGAAALAGGATGLAAALPGIAQGAVQGGISGLASGDPLTGALRGGLTAGLQSYAQPALQSVFDMFSPDIDFAMDMFDDPLKRTGMLDAATPFVDPYAADPFGTAAAAFEAPSVAAASISPDTLLMEDTLRAGMEMGALPGGENLYTGMLESTGFPAGANPDILRGLADPYGILEAPDIGATALPDATLDPDLEGLTGEIEDLASTPAPTAPASRALSPERAKQLAKLGMKLNQMRAGHGQADEGAPQRAEGQSDAQYSQSLAEYLGLDMGDLVPGTPEYYDYLMQQFDAVVGDLADLDGEALAQQLRSKTRGELEALRRALYVRGQLDQLMGTGDYTDPFTGLSERVVTGARRVNPGVAAYHRGLGRTLDEFSQLTPIERREAIGGFLGRESDLYGMQARADARAEQAAQAQAYFEDLKRRRGMFSQSAPVQDFSMMGTGDPQLDELLGLFSQ